MPICLAHVNGVTNTTQKERQKLCKLAGRSGTAKGVNKQEKVFKLTTQFVYRTKAQEKKKIGVLAGEPNSRSSRTSVAAGIRRGMWGCEFWYRYEGVQD